MFGTSVNGDGYVGEENPEEGKGIFDFVWRTKEQLVERLSSLLIGHTAHWLRVMINDKADLLSRLGSRQLLVIKVNSWGKELGIFLEYPASRAPWQREVVNNPP